MSGSKNKLKQINMKIIFFGAGYCTNYIIPLLPKNARIICTHNEEIKPQKYDEQLNIKRLRLNAFIEQKDFHLSDSSFILNSIPPKSEGDLILKHLSKTIIKFSQNIKWYGYFSSTSVYGNHSGKWVDENSNLNPTNLRGKLRKKSEIQHLELYKLYNIPIHIFRLPGIYGPERSIFERLQLGQKIQIVKKGHFFSRIHVEDIANAVFQSMRKITPGEIFNICDDMPSQSDEIVKYAAKLMNIKNVKSVNFNDSKLNEKTKSFYLDNKKVKNDKIKKILNWTPKFRTYKLGLDNLFNLLSNENSSTNSSFIKKN